jgi:hypothetical protein
MNEVSQEAWFYSRDGQRLGPVSFAELQAMAQQSGLDPRLDMVWTQGMATWQAAGEIQGLFEKRALSDTQGSLAPPADPYTPPKLESIQEMMSRVTDWPGARRRGFLFATIIFPLLWQGAISLCAGFLTQEFGPRLMGVLGIGLGAVPILVGIYFGLMRLVNLGMSRWWYLANFVPILNLWIGYRCFACPAGYAYHKKLDGVGVALAIFYWLLVALTILAIAAVVALMLGALGNPELQEQIQDFIRAAQEQAATR